MEKKTIDLEKLTKDELLAKYADRFIAYEKSGSALAEWEASNDYSRDEEYCDDYAELKMAHDNDWLALREITRFVKKDDSILA